jgi:hypothetical protein
MSVAIPPMIRSESTPLGRQVAEHRRDPRCMPSNEDVAPKGFHVFYDE